MLPSNVMSFMKKVCRFYKNTVAFKSKFLIVIVEVANSTQKYLKCKLQKVEK